MVFQQPAWNEQPKQRHLHVVSGDPQQSGSFGALLASWRTRLQLGQKDLVEELASSFEEAAIEQYNVKTYGNLERDERLPRFQELFPLLQGYAKLFEEFDMSLSARDVISYLELAQVRLQESKSGRRIKAEQWQTLQKRVFDLFHIENAQREEEEEEQQKRQAAERERRRVLTQLEQDTSHIIGREEYCSHLISFQQDRQPPRKKVVAITGMTGLGKTSIFKVLQKQLLDLQVGVINCEFQGSEAFNTPRDWFDRFIAQVYNYLQPKQNEIAAVPSADKQIQRTLQAIAAQSEPLVILVDDAQRLIEETTKTWCEEWKQFMHGFLQSEHQATLYLASREWPVWQDREGSFLIHEEVPTISLESAAKIWQNLGFANEDADTLQKATERCGYNPRMMELVAQKINLPDVSFDWENSWDSFDLTESTGLTRFLNNPHITGAVPLLEDIIGRTISEDAKKLLKVLALAPVPLPPPLVVRISPSAKQHTHELIRASLLAKRPDRLVLLPLVAEAVYEYATQEEKEQLADALIDAYNFWLTAGKFHDEAEQALVVAELLILYLQQHRLLDAANLLISSGWLAYQFGHGVRLARICQDTLKECNWRQSPDLELAANLLDDRLAAFRGEKIKTAEKAKRYQTLYQQAQDAGIQLSSTTIVHLLQPIILHLSDIAQFQEAEALVNAHLSQMASSKNKDPLTYTSFLYCRGKLLARLAEHKQNQQTEASSSPKQITPTAKELFEEALQIFQECIALLKESERGASPLQKSRAIYKRARRLNDFAYYGRISGADSLLIQEALDEGIRLEKMGYTTPGSLATALGEYAQYLASIGHFQDALLKSDQALEEAEKFVASGYAKAKRERAVLLVERAEIYVLIGDIDKAKELFMQAKPDLEKDIRREKYFRKAEAGLKMISHLDLIQPKTRDGLRPGLLDKAWYTQYKNISSFDYTLWLSQSGPFTDEEAKEWRKYSKHGQVNEMQSLMNLALHREIDKAVQEQRAPYITYPAISSQAVEQKLKEFSKLKITIEEHEPNQIVKNLYRETIDEQIHLLRMVQATQEGDREAFDFHNRAISPIPTSHEIEIAAGELLKITHQGKQFEATKDLALRLEEKLQTLQLITDFNKSIESPKKDEHSIPLSLSQIRLAQNPLPINEVVSFLEQCLRVYGFDGWHICVENNTTGAFVESNTKKIALPNREMAATRVLHLLAHEVEGHARRHHNGEKSKLSLLGDGLAGYLPIEEALAVRYTALAEHKPASLPWIGTLATGLAIGVTAIPGKMTEPLGYYQLYLFMRDYHSLNQMLQGKDANTAKNNAHRFAQRRCLRTFEGVPSLSEPGVCSLQDHSYLHGTLLLEEFLSQNSSDAIEQLSVGCISLDHLWDCEQLGITRPIVPSKHLAMQDDCLRELLALAKKYQ